MKLLAFDTCMQACSAAVLVDDGGEPARLWARFEPMNQGHAERLLPMIGEVLHEAGLAMTDIDRIAVTRGPGSFTGVRIGVAAARGLALATGAELVGEDALRVIAAGYLDAHPQHAEAPVCVAIDARRGQVYCELFAGLTPQGDGPQALTPADAAARLPADPRLQLVGGGAGLLHAALRALGRTPPPLPAVGDDRPQPTAAALARLARLAPVTNAPLAPLYLRPPDATPAEGFAVARASEERL